MPHHIQMAEWKFGICFKAFVWNDMHWSNGGGGGGDDDGGFDGSGCSCCSHSNRIHIHSHIARQRTTKLLRSEMP